MGLNSPLKMFEKSSWTLGRKESRKLVQSSIDSSSFCGVLNSWAIWPVGLFMVLAVSSMLKTSFSSEPVMRYSERAIWVVIFAVSMRVLRSWESASTDWAMLLNGSEVLNLVLVARSMGFASAMSANI